MKTGIEVAKENPGYMFKREWRNGLLIVEGECRETGIKRRCLACVERMRDWFNSQEEAFGHLSIMVVDQLDLAIRMRAYDELDQRDASRQ